MTVTERKKNKPPTFQHLPKDRAKKLKKSWIENKRVKSQWKAQKRREGLMKQPISPGEGSPDQESEETKSGLASGTSIQSHLGDALITSGRTPAAQQKEHGEKSIREPKRPTSLHTHTLGFSRGRNAHRTHGRGGRNLPDRGREKGQPNMTLRMNVMLEKIKRDFS
ncbi:hypothetical protein PAXRUDRAFT_143177 [Paxillus rubicundulus Ve08.2h10]|uniref:rRNA-processing protein FYV7 n=1 Tax=Paxillus rubicundulus Ve08.2h10 TaxID=930991 RepID=A0A0D0DAZ1_9AGAM|nr:hypothetical protein PAXRUDRAFT_143177 [Paxillus rubicundulus Ve08.2h10]